MLVALFPGSLLEAVGVGLWWEQHCQSAWVWEELEGEDCLGWHVGFLLGLVHFRLVCPPSELVQDWVLPPSEVSQWVLAEN